MAKRKKNPLPSFPDDAWYSIGAYPEMPSWDTIETRLKALCAKGVIELVSCPEPDLGDVWRFNAVWRTKDGARIRAQLGVGPEDSPPVQHRQYQPDPDKPVRGIWEMAAQADRPWDYAWPSPADMFFDRRMTWGTPRGLSYGRRTMVGNISPEVIQQVMDDSCHEWWNVVLLTHDPRSRSNIEQDMGHEASAVDSFPASLRGRVLELRLHGSASRTIVNKALARYGLGLPTGGAALLVPPARRRGLRGSDLWGVSVPPLALGGAAPRLADTLVTILRNSGPSQEETMPKKALQALQEDWTLLLPEEEEQQEPSLSEEEALEELLEWQSEANEELADRLEQALGFAETFRRQCREARGMLDEALAREGEILKAWQKDRVDLELLHLAIGSDQLGVILKRTEQERDSALEDTEVAEELLDEQAREIAWLRRELARAGQPHTVQPPEEQGVPASWEDLLVAAARMPFLALGDLETSLKTLRGHTSERVWIRRSWEAMQTLNAYGLVKKERGADEVPHLTAYLRRTDIDFPLPETRYVSAESQLSSTHTKFVSARTFPVPRSVHPSGKAVMTTHIRIGSGKPPAPRLHFYDDTSGASGLIHVGYLGEHLPNAQTN